MARKPVRWSRLPVRTKVLASVLAMTLLGMVVTGVLTYVIQLRLLDASIAESLEQEVAEFHTLAAEGRDPDNGQPFASVERLLEVALLRNVPDRNEIHLAFVDGVARSDPEEESLLEEPEVRAAVTVASERTQPYLTEAAAASGIMRLALVPVRIAGDPSRGTYVVAYAVDQARQETTQLARIYVAASLLSLLLVGAVGWLVAGRLLQPLSALRRATQRISGTDLGERIPVRGEDDVSELTRTYNEMLDRLEAAFETQRRFLDDAGHELRTPLTILRGHLDVLDASDPDDVTETKELLLDEVDRMSRMVEDLILLSKSRRPDFLICETIDLATLTAQLLDKARGLGDRQWTIDSLGGGRFPGDVHRLTQALMELAANAVKFSDPGSTIAIGSATADGNVRLWVRDQGAGIAAGDEEQIFRRFSRVRSGRNVPGSGLGLSIVAAIAEAHGGRVEVSSAPGQGSTFIMVLPAFRKRSSGAPARPEGARA